jgi:hypothetical protein
MNQTSLVNVKTYNMMKKIIPMIMAIFFAMTAIGQTVKFSNDATSPPGSVAIDLDFSDFSANFNAATLQVEVDKELLIFTHYTNLASGSGSFSQTDDKLSFSWFDMAGFSNGTLVTMHFNYLGSFTANLDFIAADCEVATSQGVAYDVTYINGSVNPQTDVDGFLRLTEIDNAIVGSPVSIAVEIWGNAPTSQKFGSINAMSLDIGIDPDQLNYLDVSSNPYGFQVAYADGTISLSWSNTTGTDFIADPANPIELLVFDFNYMGGGDAPLAFLPGSTVENWDESQPILNVDFFDGHVNPDPDLATRVIIGEAFICAIQEDPPLENLTVEIPVTMENMPTISAFDFFIEFDTDVITYMGLIDLHAGIPSGTLQAGVNQAGNVLAVTWNLGAEVDLNGELFKIKFDFQYDPETTYDPMPDFSSDIIFKGGSVIRRASTEPVEASYINGYVGHARALTLELFLEGLYDSGQMTKAQDHDGSAPFDKFSGDVADQITVELRDNTDYTNLIWSATAIDLSTSGEAIVQVPYILDGTYWITVKHRNHLETVYKDAIDFSTIGCDEIINFYDSDENAYEDNQKDLLDGNFAIFAGDVDQNGSIDIDDLGVIGPDILQVLKGYKVTDIDGSGVVDLDDYQDFVAPNVLSITVRKTP